MMALNLRASCLFSLARDKVTVEYLPLHRRFSFLFFFFFFLRSTSGGGSREKLPGDSGLL